MTPDFTDVGWWDVNCTYTDWCVLVYDTHTQAWRTTCPYSSLNQIPYSYQNLKFGNLFRSHLVIIDFLHPGIEEVERHLL